MENQSDQNNFGRHYSALMRKNFICWKRTPGSSVMEVGLTVLLCFVLINKAITQRWETSYFGSIVDDRRPYYPAFTLDNSTANWTNDWTYAAEQSADYKNFMKWGNWNEGLVTDPLSPYWWNPQMMCYQDIERPYFNPSIEPWSMPIIAFVKNENQIQSDLVQQLKLQFQNQKNSGAFLKEFFESGMAHDMHISRWDMQFLFGWTHTNYTNFNSTSIMSFANFTFMEFESHDAIDAYVKSDTYGTEEQPGICFAFSFEEKNTNKFELTLRFSDQDPLLQIPNASKINFFSQNSFSPDQGAVQRWSYSGFSIMQNWAANTILKRKSGVSNANILTMVVPLPHEDMQASSLYWAIRNIFFFYLLMFWLPLLYRTVYRIVLEKQSKVQEVMRMMGMTNLPYWLSWWTYYTMISLFISIVAWLLLQFTLFRSSEPILLLVFFIVFGQSLFGVIMVTQSLFNDAQIACISCSLMYFGAALMAFAFSTDQGLELKIAMMFLNPSLCLSLGIETYIKFALTPQGMNFSNWKIPIRGVSLFNATGIMAVSGIIWLVLGIYLEVAIPKNYGSKKGYCFCITCCFTCCRRKTGVQSEEYKNQDSDFDTKYFSKSCFEPVSRLVAMKELENKILKIQDLEKHYQNGTKAVNGVNLKLYSDQIFVLLGHNGAGKTTTISVLSGLLEPTTGSATVFGKNLCGDNYSARRLMGVCPQYDVLFDLLTPEEHLDFFYELKGATLDTQKKNEEIQKLMVDVGVDDKKDAMSMTLSGGNKRKLSVAIALVGGSKFLIFDEPTAGMDLNARRHLWNMFKKYKEGRIILMSTHYMDEADILGDRIGIMCAGQMTCMGSSIFLKKKFGIGYNMVVMKSSSEPNTLLLPYLHKNLGNKTLITSEIQSEITIKIPETYATKFTIFFADFDLKLASLQIRNYGISISSLEEVFMKVGSLKDLSSLDQESLNDSGSWVSTSHESDSESDNQFMVKKKLIESDVDENTDSEEMTEQKEVLIPKSKPQNTTSKEISSNFSIKKNFADLDTSFSSNINAILYKKMSIYRRNKMGCFYEVVLPIIVILFGIILTQLVNDNKETPTTLMDASLIPKGVKTLFNPQMVDLHKSNLPASAFAKNLKTQGKFDIEYNANWTTNSSASMYIALNYSYDWGHSVSYSPPWHYGDYVMFSANKTSQEYKFYSLVNTTATGPYVVYPQMMYESILRVALEDPELEFSTIWNDQQTSHFSNFKHQYTEAYCVYFTLAISISMMLAGIVGQKVQERISGLKHLQILSGMQTTSYWVANFIFDWSKIQIVMMVTCLAIWIIKLNVEVTYFVWLTVSFPLVPCAYATSFFYSSESAAQIMTMFLNFYVIAILNTSVLAERGRAGYEAQGDIKNWVFRMLFPSYVISDSLNFEVNKTLLERARRENLPISIDPWNINNQLGDLVCSAANAILWLLILILIESCNCKSRPGAPLSQKSAQKKQENKKLDEDVILENNRVADGCVGEIIVQGFSKEFSKREAGLCSFSKFQAVDNLSFALEIGECFALLGVNGAGKTTTFKSLTNEVMPDVGRFSLGGFDLFSDFDQARKLIGYSPQHNLVFETMNVEEHVQYYARLKGIPAKFRGQIVEETIQRLGLVAQRYESVGSLSGGNQRKVCAAVALVGNPPIILLDEPSAGMDPKARRFMWEVVAKITQKKQSAIVLTTHSMEEAEALSTKMGIMVKGGIFKCFGSSQHIRNKFGTGYVLEIKIRTVHEDEFPTLWGEYFQDSENKPLLNQKAIEKLGIYLQQELQEEMKAFQELELLRFVHGYLNIYQFVADICEYFGNCVEKIEIFGNTAKFRVERNNRSIGFVFGLIEKIKSKHQISEYSVSQTTLEQIFQVFADLNFQDSILKFNLKDEQLQVQN